MIIINWFCKFCAWSSGFYLLVLSLRWSWLSLWILTILGFLPYFFGFWFSQSLSTRHNKFGHSLLTKMAMIECDERLFIIHLFEITFFKVSNELRPIPLTKVFWKGLIDYFFFVIDSNALAIFSPFNSFT